MLQVFCHTLPLTLVSIHTTLTPGLHVHCQLQWTPAFRLLFSPVLLTFKDIYSVLLPLTFVCLLSG